MLSRLLFLIALRLTALVVVISERRSYQVAARAVRIRVTSVKRISSAPKVLPVQAMKHCQTCGIYTLPSSNPCRNTTCPLKP
jgi:ABC-type transporter Mla MlaB component